MTYRELFDKANRLVDAGEITLGEYNEMTNPLDREVEHLDKIKAEIAELDVFYDNDYFSGNKDAMVKRNEVLQIIDKYKENEE